MTQNPWPKSYCPLILRFFRLVDAFAKADDERDFFLDRCEGCIILADLSKSQAELDALYEEIAKCSDRYIPIPKLSFFEAKKIMEGFVNEKVYDIDIKEKLLEITQSRDARENFLEFVYDQHAEVEKWQSYFVERFRIKIIEWLREQNLKFVFEEDLEILSPTIDKVKRTLFQPKVAKEVASAREALATKAQGYYSSEALNPRPKRGRPPKQIIKIEIETTVTPDLYTQVAAAVRPFLYLADISSPAEVTFSSRFDSEEAFLAHLRGGKKTESSSQLEQLSQRLASLQALSNRLGKPIV